MSSFLNEFNSQLELAAPSWVVPGTVADNCYYLAGKVDEVALLFFEARSCLAYTEVDLPAELIDTGLSFHIHHPLDLPWHEGGLKVAEIVLALNDLAAHLNPTCHVIHPPQAGPDADVLICEFAAGLKGGSIKSGKILFENIKENSLLEQVTTIRNCGFKICLDLGHILSYAQQDLLKHKDLAGMVSMVHLNAPGAKGRHESLELLDGSGKKMMKTLLDILSDGGTVTIEVFEEKGFFNSLQFLKECCSGE
ncbi:cobamide remodeling phosphodiesterase CbiR [Maridesulfovibrio hydrothermalis]|uniref:Xylose isomerase-like TIM barrel domain-containing protein n=1 Tax=Maridesulfovibrio hydrothermalis AM13 = DSM 14728 TaxID=1121451 RepID=L0RF92_9BACT|nr:cobamide remodeling phosphodiesterase CbiR [Maridesulfovibrio hydrothermalis]CCO25438.1 conserved protein of unknown function [Maridesulfovibrio hydrothermalis AM13 = DSM 14728]